MNEAALKRKINSTLQRRFPYPLLWIWGITAGINNGIPDTYYLSQTGSSLWIEYKIHPNKLTKLQEHRISHLNTCKQNAILVTYIPTTKQYTILQKGEISNTNDIITWIIKELNLC